MNKNTNIEQTNGLESQFEGLLSLIEQKRSEASRAVNEKQLMTAWVIGGYVSAKLKSSEWGSKVVTQFAEYIRVHAPHLKGFTSRNIYNFVMLFDEYSSQAFNDLVAEYLPVQFVQSVISQFEDAEFVSTETRQLAGNEIVQSATGQIVSPMIRQLDSDAEIVQSVISQFPKILLITSYTNHISILSRCPYKEQRLFYMLYSYKERLTSRELQRCISTDTFSHLLGKRKNMSKALLECYPQSPVLFKDTLFVDFLGLPTKHTEPKMRRGIVEHMKQFILELGKDFLFVDQEYYLEVGASRYKSDLLFYHRGLQCLVAIELKKTKFHPRDLGQLEFYLEALDRDVRRSNENPSIGIILCPEADHVVVEYALSRSLSPTMVAEYKRLLIPQEKMQLLLREYCVYIAEE